MENEWEKKLEQLLGSPDALEKIEQAMAAFGVSPTESAPPPKPSDSPDLSGLLQLLPLLSSLDSDDHNTALLHALRPYLHGEREKRLEESMKFLKLAKVLPLLQEKGVFR